MELSISSGLYFIKTLWCGTLSLYVYDSSFDSFKQVKIQRSQQGDISHKWGQSQDSKATFSPSLFTCLAIPQTYSVASRFLFCAFGVSLEIRVIYCLI